MKRLMMAALLAISACGQAPIQSEAPATTASAAWDRDLLTLMPQIDACIERSNGLRYVSYAGARDGATLVRLGGEKPMDCRVTSAPGAALVVTITPRDEALAIDGEDDAIFVRGPGKIQAANATRRRKCVARMANCSAGCSTLRVARTASPLRSTHHRFDARH